MITTVVHLVLAGSLYLVPANHDAPELRALEREHTFSPRPDGTPSTNSRPGCTGPSTKAQQRADGGASTATPRLRKANRRHCT